ncbi:MAG: ribonuclease P protein component [Lentisphaerae bacterium]|nr:ribonuclease P protein component [Lentisphaerota bacterium]
MREGRRLAGRYAVIWSAPGGAPGGARLGVVAAKRVFRRAVDRNRAKRLLREAFRLNRNALRRDVDVVLLARAAILEAGRAAVERDLLALAARARLLADGKEPELR